MRGRPGLIREVGGHAMAQGGALLLSAALMLAIAAAMGPDRFGQWSGLLAVSALFMPVASLRIETRLAVADSAEARRMLVAAALAANVGFVLLALGMAPLLARWWAPAAVLLAALVAAMTCAIEAVIGACASQGALSLLRLLRFVRFVVPAFGAWLASLLRPDWLGVMLGWTAGLGLALTVALIAWEPVRPSWAALAQSWRVHRAGLRDSLWMGLLNAAWLNGMLPVLNLAGLSVLAGQYAVVQRLLGAPLGVLGMAINATLLREGNGLHRSARRMVLLAAWLGMAAAAMAGMLWVGLFVQPWWTVPAPWRMPPALCAAAAFFLGSSFAVGSISVAAIRLKDETYLALWQTVALAGWAVGIWMAPTPNGLVGLLLWGGLAYWVLLWRWTQVATRTTGVYG